MNAAPELLWGFLRDLWSVDLDVGALRARLSETTTLDFWNGPAPDVEVMAALFALPECANLERLDLTCSGTNDGILERLADTAHFARLASLTLWDTHVTLDGVHALLHSTTLRRLHTLGLQNLALGPELAEVLASSPLAQALRDLRISANGLGAEGVHTIAHALPDLERLDIDSNDLGLSGARALAGAPLTSLSRLELSYNELGPEAFAALAASPHFGALRTLVLEESDLGDAHLEPLADSTLVTDLEALHLPHNHIEGPGLLAILAKTRLRTLDLSSNPLGYYGDDACVAIVGHPALQNMEHLALANCHIWDRAVQAIATSPHTENLHTLELGSNQIGDEGALALADTSNLPALQFLRLGHNEITDRGARALERRQPALDVLSLSSNFHTLAKGSSDPSALDDAFGEVRSALQAPDFEVSSLSYWLDNALDTDPEAYLSRWVPYLQESPVLRALEPFFVHTTREARVVLRRFPFATISMTLGGGDFTHEMDLPKFAAFSQEPQARQLRSLELYRTHIGQDVVDILASSEHMSGLEALDICQARVGDLGASKLAGATHLSNLRRLRLADAGISEAGRATLASAPHLSECELSFT